MNKYILILLVLLTSTFNGYAQDHQKGKIYGMAEIGHLRGIGNVNGGIFTYPNTEGRVYRLRLSLGYFIHSQVSVGAGFGLDGYHDPSYNTRPVYLDIRGYLPKGKHNLFSFINLGWAIGGETFTSGKMGAIGVGYRLAERKVQFCPSIGINFQEMKSGSIWVNDLNTGQSILVDTKSNLTNVCFNLGFLF